MLLALDPGKNSPGAAIFGASGLVDAARIRVPAGYADFPEGARWLQVALLITAWTSTYTIDAVIFERPQWYARSKSKGDPNQLAGIAGVAANVTGILSVYRRIEVFSPVPSEWIGQLPKTCPVCKANKKKCPECRGSAWETPRGRRIRSRLSPAELALVPDQNDAIDAVGLGLWKQKRLEKVSVFSNGRDGR